MKINSKELQDYIKTTVHAIKDGAKAIEGFKLKGSIKFKLAVTNVKEGKGGLKIYVVGVGAKHKSEELTTISFEIEPKEASVIIRPRKNK